DIDDPHDKGTRERQPEFTALEEGQGKASGERCQGENKGFTPHASRLTPHPSRLSRHCARLRRAQVPCAGAAVVAGLGGGSFGGTAVAGVTGLGGRGSRPSMMSFSWSESIVSHSSRVLAIFSTFARFSSMILRATR